MIPVIKAALNTIMLIIGAVLMMLTLLVFYSIIKFFIVNDLMSYLILGGLLTGVGVIFWCFYDIEKRHQEEVKP